MSVQAVSSSLAVLDVDIVEEACFLKAEDALEGYYVQSCSSLGLSEAAVLEIIWPQVGFVGVEDNSCLSLKVKTLCYYYSLNLKKHSRELECMTLLWWHLEENWDSVPALH